MPSKVEESLRWLGISKGQLVPIGERVYTTLVDISKETRRPVRAVDIANRLNRHRNSVLAHLGSLRDRNRAANIVGGWIPLK